MANVVLVHGAWCDGSSWQDVIGPLQSAGHQVLAVQNPLTSLADDIAWTRRQIATMDGPVALVGHSYGGAVISGAALDNGQVAGLVFVAAYAPDDGETVLGLGERFAATSGGAAIRATDDGWLTLDRALFHEAFAADVPAARAAILAAVQKPTHGACFATPAGRAAWHSLPCAYLRSTDDHMINPDLQAWMAERMKATTTNLTSSHASPVSHGADVAAAILAILE
jgi:pimeloyl-ACP methyl ester carboxylesterase